MPTTDQATAQVSQATLTVAQLLELDVVQRADPEILAGAGQLGSPVRQVHISPLVPTLRSFLDHGGHISAAARELFIERRTLYHRMEVIGKLIGRDLSNPDTRLRLSVALRALDLLHTHHGGDRPLHHD